MTEHHEWNSAELAILRRMSKDKMPWKTIAAQIGTVNARQARGKAVQLGWHKPHVRTRRIKVTVLLPVKLHLDWSKLVQSKGDTKARRFRALVSEDLNQMIRETESP